LLPALAALAALLALAGCFARTTAPKAPIDLAPAATTPAGAVHRFEWCWQNRDIDRYAGLLTADFVVVPSPADSIAQRGPQPWTRDAEIAAIRHLFVGGPTNPGAAKITLEFDRTLIALPDTLHPGDPLRRMTSTHLDLNVVVDHGDGSTQTDQIQGKATFYLVRGDKAALPAEAIALGAKPDSTQWWVERIDDHTLPLGGLHVLPAHAMTWHWLRVIFQ
jgi:hypothetical protein